MLPLPLAGKALCRSISGRDEKASRRLAEQVIHQNPDEDVLKLCQNASSTFDRLHCLDQGGTDTKGSLLNPYMSAANTSKDPKVKKPLLGLAKAFRDLEPDKRPYSSSAHSAYLHFQASEASRQNDENRRMREPTWHKHLGGESSAFDSGLEVELEPER